MYEGGYQGGYYDGASCYKFWQHVEEILMKRTFEEVSSPSTYFQSYLEERLRDGN
jgi:hypothetical protein